MTRHYRHMKRLTLGLITALAVTGCVSGDDPVSYKEYALKGSYSAAISAKGNYAALGSFNHGGSLWQLSNHARKFNWNHQAGGFSIIAATAFSPEEAYAVTANQQDLVLWDVISGKSEGFWSSPAEILDIDLSAGGNYALLGLADHTAVYFDVKNGGVKKTFRHQARVRSVDLSDDGTLVLTGDDDYKTRLWDLESGEQLHELSLGNVVDTVALSPNGRYAFSSGSLDQAIIWDTNSGKTLKTLAATSEWFPKRVSYLSARFSPDSKKLLTGTASGLVQLWDVRKGKELRRWRAHKREQYGPVDTGIYAVGFGPGKKYFALASNGIMNVLK